VDSEKYEAQDTLATSCKLQGVLYILNFGYSKVSRVTSSNGLKVIMDLSHGRY